MADGRHMGKCWKCYNSPTSRPIWTKRGFRMLSSPRHSAMMCGCHGNGRCLATAHWTFSSYVRLEAESVNQFWWNFVHNNKFVIQYDSHLTKCDKLKKNSRLLFASELRLMRSTVAATSGGQVASQAPTRLPQNRGRCLLTAQWTFWFYGA